MPVTKCLNIQCKSDFQDKEYGPRMRAQNPCKKRSLFAGDPNDQYVRCTVCGQSNPRTPPAERGVAAVVVKKQKFKKGSKPKKKTAAPKDQAA